VQRSSSGPISHAQTPADTAAMRDEVVDPRSASFIVSGMSTARPTGDLVPERERRRLPLWLRSRDMTVKSVWA